MNLAGGLGRFRADVDGPGPAFDFTGSQIGLQAQQLEARLNKTVQARFRQPFHFQIFFCFFFRQFRNLRLHFGRNHHHLRMLLGSELLHRFHMGIAAGIRRFFFRHVADINDGFPCQQMQVVKSCFFLLGKLHPAGRHNILQPFGDAFQQRLFRRRLFIMGFQQLFHFFHAVVDGINIRQA